MKLEKKHWMIIGVVIAVVVIWYMFFKKKPAESAYDAAILVPEAGNWGSESGYTASDIGGPESGYTASKCQYVDKKTGLLKDCGGGVVVKMYESNFTTGGSKPKCPNGSSAVKELWLNDVKQPCPLCCAYPQA